MYVLQVYDALQRPLPPLRVVSADATKEFFRKELQSWLQSELLDRADLSSLLRRFGVQEELVKDMTSPKVTATQAVCLLLLQLTRTGRGSAGQDSPPRAQSPSGSRGSQFHPIDSPWPGQKPVGLRAPTPPASGLALILRPFLYRGR